MRTVWKIILDLTPAQTVTAPEGSQLLGVQIQDGKPILWLLADLDRPARDRTITIHATGTPLPEQVGTYLGSVQHPVFRQDKDAGWVMSEEWHIFEAPNGMDT